MTDVAQEQPMDAAAELASLPSVDAAADAGLQPGGHESDSAAARVGGPVPPSAYAMMWLGELLGEAIAAAYVGLVLRLGMLQVLWAACVAGEITKAWLGARSARRGLGRPATSDQRVRMALWYTMTVTCGGISLLLLAALVLPHSLASKLDWMMAIAVQVSQRGWAVLTTVVFVGVGCTVLLRYLLLTLFNPRR